jgi:hypothetical protein
MVYEGAPVDYEGALANRGGFELSIRAYGATDKEIRVSLSVKLKMELLLLFIVASRDLS